MNKKNKKKCKPQFVLDCVTTNSKLKEYNGLSDENLAGFFTSLVRRTDLIRNKLISPKGFIITKKLFRREKPCKIVKCNLKDGSIGKYKSLSPKASIKSLPATAYKKEYKSETLNSNKKKNENFGTRSLSNVELSQAKSQNKISIPRLRIRSEINNLPASQESIKGKSKFSDFQAN